MEENFFTGKRVLVTGGTGFVGGHFAEALHELGARVRVTVHTRPPYAASLPFECVRADLTREEDALAACEGMDLLVHCAGAALGVGVGSAGKMRGITDNVILAARVFHAAWAQGVGRMLVFGSSTGYPALDHPVREEEFWSADVYPGYFGYGWMRRYTERLAEFVQRESATAVTLVRPVAIYGPRDNFDPASSHVVPALIRRAVAGETPFTVWGAGTVVRDFLHVRDFVRGSLLAFERLPGADPVNIAYGAPTTIADVVAAILKAAGRPDCPVIYDATKPTALPFRMADTAKARRLLDFAPQIGLEQGIADTVDWFKGNCL